MSAFTTPLRVQFVDGTWWVLLAPFEYYVGDEENDERIFVHAGFKTDFASIPGFAWSIIGHPTGKYGKASVVHDYIYRYPVCGVEKPRSRRRCDQIMLEAMKVLGVGWWRRSAMYFAVRAGGRGAWKKWRKAE